MPDESEARIAELEAKLAAAATELQELRRYRAMIERSPDTTWLLGADGEILFASSNSVRARRPNGPQARTLWEILAPENHQAVRDALARIVADPSRTVFIDLRALGSERECAVVNALDDPDLRGILVVTRDISGQNESRRVLQEAYDRYALAAEAAGEHVWEWDVNMDRLKPSRLLAAHLDVTAPLGLEDVLFTMHPDDRGRMRDKFRKLAEDGGALEADWRLLGTDGGYRWHRSMAHAVTDGQGNVRLLGRTSDIHDRKIVELALKGSEERFRALFEATHTAVTLRDGVDQSFIDCNDAALRIYGMSSREQFRETNPADLAVNPQPNGSDPARLLRDSLAVAREEGSVRIEWVARRADGSAFDAQFTISRIEVEGRPIWQTIVEDVSERRRIARAAERQLAQTGLLRDVSQRLLKEDPEAAEPAILKRIGVVMDAVSVALYESEAGRSQLRRCASWSGPGAPPSPPFMFDVRASGPLGAGHRQVGSANAAMETLAIVGRDHRLGFHLMRPGGVPWGSDDATTLEAVTELIAAARARRDAERALSLAKEAALAASRAKTTFVATMSHEIRSPLSGVIGTVDLLASTRLDERQRRYVELARASARGLLSVVNDILDFSKIEAGKFEMADVEFSIQDLMDEAVSIFALHAAEKRIGLSCLVDVAERLRGDQSRLRQVLVNLIGNAVKFTARGEVRVSASVVSRDDTRAVLRCEVADTGIGIERSALSSIFQPFEQLNADGGGTGLGLTISRELIERMGGKLLADSAPGAGSTFWFEVPLPRVVGSLGSLDWVAPPNERALVVADRANERRALVVSLERRGLHVDEAASIANGVGLIAERAYELVIVVDEPAVLDARAFVQACAQHRSERPRSVVFVESLDRPLTTDELESLPISAHCPRPIWSGRLDAIVAERLAGPRSAAPSLHATARATTSAPLLVVDDSAMNAEIAVEVLRRAGYRVDVARTGEEALTKIGQQSYALVLLDCRLPGIDGYETARRVRALEGERKGRRVPLLAFTASATSEDRARSLDAGMDDHLTKPFEVATLLGAIASHLASNERPPNPLPGPVGATVRADQRIDLERAIARLDGNASILWRAASRFAELAPESIALVRAAIDRRDAEGVEFAVHRLRGQASMFDAVPLVRSADELSAAVELGEWPDIEASAERMKVEVDAALRALEAARSTSSS